EEAPAGGPAAEEVLVREPRGEDAAHVREGPSQARPVARVELCRVAPHELRETARDVDEAAVVEAQDPERERGAGERGEDVGEAAKAVRPRREILSWRARYTS